MKQQRPKPNGRQSTTLCPECNISLSTAEIPQHILSCAKYIPTYVNNVRRFVDQMSPNYIQFLICEMDLIKEELYKKIEPKDEALPKFEPKIDKQNKNKPNPQLLEVEKNKPSQKLNQKSNDKKPAQSKPDQKKPAIDQTLQLQDLYGSKDPFPADRRLQQKIQCADPTCTLPVSADDIENFTYLDECLHTMCKYCFRNYVRNNFVKSNGQLKCPSKKCSAEIQVMQIQQIVDPTVFAKLDSELNSKFMSLLVECHKCHEQYHFQKGKPSDAPKQTTDGRAVTNSMAKHYAQNRFQCPKCRWEQCKSCKEGPYHLGLNCEQYRDHKLKKKCRYCQQVLPKGYMSETGIHTFDDICEAPDCAVQMKEACSKRLACGHSCSGIIKEKNCLPCLREECALGRTQELLGENENSYCSLCYVQTLVEAPCVRSKCGHIFHLKCLRKRLELKWGTPRITFRFCQCPLCNKWMEIPEECTLSKSLQNFKALFEKIREKALKRLNHEGQNKDPRLTDPASPYYKDEAKYAMAIYAYFQCFECHQPYFGGRKSCAQAMNQAKQGQKFNPKELICPACCPVEVTDCKKHGKEFISFKCRYCCSVAQWFCWGSTHFCDLCHKKQIQGEYVSRLTKDKLPKCGGKGTCPVGGEHGGNGDQFCLGCGVCRGERGDIRDF